MPFKLSLSDDERYVILKVWGDVTRQTAMEQNLEAHEFGRQRGVNRYLVDMSESRNVDTVLANYQFAYDDMEHTPGIDKAAKVALLVSEGDHSHDFIETVAKNAGLNVTLFTDEQKAIQHLLQRWS